MTTIRSLLESIYGPDAAEIAPRLAQLVAEFKAPSKPARPLDERDAVLITYGDMVSLPGIPPLKALAEFLGETIRGVISSVHILPFFPYSSDDGFSVIDYRTVDPALGTWADIEALGHDFSLMFDAVINHVSADSLWFKAFLRDHPLYRDWFVTVTGSPDLSAVVRPRTLPLLTRVETAAGPKQVWTTFSADQVDLNYANPDVLLEMVSLLLFYVTHGAELIRLDAIAYLWKEIGTRCIHLPQTHHIIQLFRAVLDQVAPGVRLITETNVPHSDNISYFGDGRNEAQLVYNFALPPLVLYTFHAGDASALSKWAARLSTPSRGTAFFNFLASHDGIGLNPARGILADAEIETLVELAQRHGGQVSYKHNPDGSQSPYELNINYFDALSDPHGGDPLRMQADRFLSAHAIMLALAGLPGIYFHSLFGSRGWPEGAQQTGRARTINRHKPDLLALRAEVADPNGLRRMVFEGMTRLLRARSGCPAFRPDAPQRVRDLGSSVFAVERTSPDGWARVLCLHNVTDAALEVGPAEGWSGSLDLLSGRQIDGEPLGLAPYQTAWLRLQPAQKT